MLLKTVYSYVDFIQHIPLNLSFSQHSHTYQTGIYKILNEDFFSKSKSRPLSLSCFNINFIYANILL